MQDFPPRQPTQENRSILSQFSQKMKICNNYNQILKTSTCNYDYFLFVLTLTRKSLEIRDYLKKIQIYNTRSKKNTVFDSSIVTTLNGTMFLVVHFAPLLAQSQSRRSPLDFFQRNNVLYQEGAPHWSRILQYRLHQRFVQQREFIYTIRPKQALNDPKDFVGFVDQFVNMIAP